MLEYLGVPVGRRIHRGERLGEIGPVEREDSLESQGLRNTCLRPERGLCPGRGRDSGRCRALQSAARGSIRPGLATRASVARPRVPLRLTAARPMAQGRVARLAAAGASARRSAAARYAVRRAAAAARSAAPGLPSHVGNPSERGEGGEGGSLNTVNRTFMPRVRERSSAALAALTARATWSQESR